MLIYCATDYCESTSVNQHRLPPTLPHRLAALVTLLLLSLAGCAKIPTPGVYKLDIQQGNVVDSEMLAKVTPGMEKRKVRFILGTPMVTDTFDPNRWYYIHSFQEGGGKRVQRGIVLVFDDERLLEVKGDVEPGIVGSGVQTEDTTQAIVSVPDQPPTGIFGGLANILDDDDTRIPREKPPPEPLEVKVRTNRETVSSSNGDETDEALTSTELSDMTVEPEEIDNVEAQTEATLPSLENEEGETGFFDRLSNKFDLKPPAEATQSRD